MSRGFGNQGSITIINETVANGGAYTGSWVDVSNYASIALAFTADAVGTLYVRFSDNGSTVRQTLQLSNGDDATSGVHGLTVIWPYAQIYFTNASGGPIALVMAISLHQSSKVSLPTSRLETVYDRYSDVLNTRVANDIELDTNRGGIAGRETVHKFGSNPDVNASSTEAIAFGGVLNMLSSANEVRIKTGGNSNDTATGTGAREVTVVGLDNNWAEISETIATNGASASSATTAEFRRVYRAYVSGFGTAFIAGATGGNVADIVIETDTGTELCTIPTGLGQTQTSLYTVPAGYTAYLTRCAATVDANKACDVRMYQRPDADDTTVPVRGRRLVTEFRQLVGFAEKNLKSWPSFPAKTDLWATASTGSGATAAVSFEYDLTLVRDV